MGEQIQGRVGTIQGREQYKGRNNTREGTIQERVGEGVGEKNNTREGGGRAGGTIQGRVGTTQGNRGIQGRRDTGQYRETREKKERGESQPIKMEEERGNNTRGEGGRGTVQGKGSIEGRAGNNATEAGVKGW